MLRLTAALLVEFPEPSCKATMVVTSLSQTSFILSRLRCIVTEDSVNIHQMCLCDAGSC